MRFCRRFCLCLRQGVSLASNKVHTMADLSDILSRPVANIKAPKQLPPGQYMFRVLSVLTKSPDGRPLVTSNGNPKLEFQVQAEAPLEVDPSQLVDINFPVSMRYTFVVTENSAFRLVAFLTDHLGLPKGTSSLTELIPQSFGKMFRGTVVHQPSNKPGDNNLYANIVETFAVG